MHVFIIQQFDLEAEVGVRSLWWHIMIVIIPDNLNPAYASNGTIYITGSDNEDGDGTGVPDQHNEDMAIISTLATGVGMPMAVLYQVRPTVQHYGRIMHLCKLP